MKSGGCKIVVSRALVAGVLLTSGCRAETPNDSALAKMRHRMVREQIVARGISDKQVIAAMEKVPRHLFVDSKYLSRAYDDHPLPIEADQTISQPYIVALMTESLKLDSTKKVLEIGTGSGYQAAILAEIAKEVYSIEIVDTLARLANARLKKQGYTNIRIRSGDGYLGWPEAAPFDGIIVTCAPPEIPQALVDQLSDDGGRMVVPVGVSWQELILIVKDGGKITKRSIAPVQFVPMIEGKKK